MRPDRWMKNASLALVTVGILCLIVEGIMRMTGYYPLRGVIEGSTLLLRRSDSPERIYEAAPDLEKYAWGSVVRTNSHGFRDRPRSVEKGPEVYRVAVLGDSVAFGIGLNQEETLTARVEHVASRSGRQVEAINMALVGYDTLQEVATLERDGLKFEPDMVVLAFTINDIGVASAEISILDRIREYRSPVYKIRLVQLLVKAREFLRFRDFLIQANTDASFSAAFSDKIDSSTNSDEVLQGLVGELREELNVNDADVGIWMGMYSRMYQSAPHLGKLRYSLGRLQEIRDREGFRLVALVFPALEETDRNRSVHEAVYRIIRHEMERVGIEVIELRQAFASEGLASVRQAEGDDIHPNGVGHRVAAQVLWGHIETVLDFEPGD